VTDQSVEVIRVSSESDLGWVDSHGWLYVTTICDMFRTKVNRHANRWYEHVNNITNHTTNHQRINRGSHHDHHKDNARDHKEIVEGQRRHKQE